MSRFILPIFLSLLFCAGCAGPKGSVRSSGSDAADGRPEFARAPMPDDSAITLVRRLEADPLLPEDAAIRRRLFEWLTASEHLHGFDGATAPVDELEKSNHPYKDELMMQFLFGGAAWRLGADTNAANLALQQEAGIRSMIAAYRNMVQLDPKLRDVFLDRLDELRRVNGLRRYIESKNKAE